MKTPPQIEYLDPYFNSDIYLSETFESIWCDLGNICSNYGLSKISIYCFDNALKHKRKSFRNLYKIAREFIFIENYEKVPEIINKLNDMDASKYYIETLTGHLLLSRNKLKESHSYFTKGILLGNPDFLLLYGIARWNELTKRHREALKYYSFIIKRYTSHVIAQKSRFRVMVICKLDNCLKYAKRFLSALENDELSFLDKESINVQLASCYELENEDELAIKICENIILTKPNFVFSYRLISYIYYKVKNYQAALEYLDHGLSLFNNDGYLYYLKGKIYFLTKKYEKAQLLLSKSVEYSNTDPYFWNSYGVACHKLKNYEQAEICFRNAISLDNNFTEARFNFMLILRLFKRVNEAKRVLDELAMNNRSDVELISVY